MFNDLIINNNYSLKHYGESIAIPYTIGKCNLWNYNQCYSKIVMHYKLLSTSLKLKLNQLIKYFIEKATTLFLSYF